MDLLIRGGRVVTPQGVVNADIGIAYGQICAIGNDLETSSADRLIDANGLWVMPGGVDAHAHIEQMSGMGQMNADTFETATRSAAMGGTTSVISFAAQAAGQSLSDTVADYAKRAQRGAMIDHAFHITITDLDVPNFEQDLGTLIEQGHRSLKVFTTYNIQLSDAQILKIMTQARHHGALVCVHAENDALIAEAKQALIDAGHLAPKFHALSHPRMAEIEAIERMCRFAEFLDQPVMIFHVSTREGVDTVRAARARGAPVWAETCTHYLLMTEEVLDKPGLEGAKWMCSPPQREEADQQALWQGLKAGDLQLISSDHAPYRYDESGKLSAGPNAGFHEIANGLPGLETRLPILFDAMVANGDESDAMAFAELTATAPARVYGLPNKGAIAVGMDADLALWDPQQTHIYGANDLHDNVGYNPWEGREIQGKVVSVVLRGSVLVEDGAFRGVPGSGKWIPRPQLATQPNGNPATDAWVQSR
ncbi:MAG: dihydropyrimidinase [Rhizobiaceae bacterium]|nr:dihydropyrimidinase [Hyphomicrobiales bacterium]NRB29300.1 dihydropyrimidinase [Rhizobiaceae bacterium]